MENVTAFQGLTQSPNSPPLASFDSMIPGFVFVVFLMAFLFWRTSALVRDLRRVNALDRALDHQTPITTTQKED